MRVAQAALVRRRALRLVAPLVLAVRGGAAEGHAMVPDDEVVPLARGNIVGAVPAGEGGGGDEAVKVKGDTVILHCQGLSLAGIA